MYRKISLIIAMTLSLVIIGGTVFSQENTEATDILRKCIVELKKTKDYTTVVYWKQRVNGELLPKEEVAYKFKRPISLYMRWIGDVKKGQELIYKKGWNNNEVMTHKGGILKSFVINLEPNSDTIMKGTRHPPNKDILISFGNTLEKNLDYALKHPEDKVRYEVIGETTIFKRRVIKIKSKTPYTKGGPYYAPVSVFGIDKKTYLPLYIASFGKDGKLWEEYRFKNLRVNVGLTNLDFDPENPDYDY